MAEVRKDEQREAFEGDLELSADQVSDVVGGRAARDPKARKRTKKAAGTKAPAKSTSSSSSSLSQATVNKRIGS